MRTALITGVTGQDGYYLSSLLLSKGYFVTGVSRRPTTGTMGLTAKNYDLQEHYPNKYEEIYGDICDSSFIRQIILEKQPDEMYNLAAQSHVGYSFTVPDMTFDTNTNAVVKMLDAIKTGSPHTKFYQASTSEMYGTVYKGMADEDTPLIPHSPYGVSKTAAHQMVSVFRDSYDVWACCGILFNHESERRPTDFVTRKITSWVAQYDKYGEDILKVDSPHSLRASTNNPLRLGNIDSVRDWGYAPDYVRGMWMMLQHDTPGDYVLATGKTHSIRDFLDIAFKQIGVDWWAGAVVHNTPNEMRPKDVTRLCGSAAKAKRVLGWTPKVSLHEMIRRMLNHDHDLLT
jgi:GDPmannose 4,6-dehydratase